VERKIKIITVMMTCLMAGMLLGAIIIYHIGPFPDVSVLRDYRPFNATKLYDREGNLIGDFAIEKRTTIHVDEIPNLIKTAFIAAEDAKFYSHGGIDLSGILRALIKNIEKFKFSQGGSTITQQLVKLLYLTPEKSIRRKILEILLAIKVDNNLSKDEILGLYLNQIYLGEGQYGIEAAARAYFGKEPDELTLGEIALIAGLPKSPGFYSPRIHLDRALIRRRYVLERMVDEKYLTPEDAYLASLEPVNLLPKQEKSAGSYFIEYVRIYVLGKYGYDALYKGGLKVFTTMDQELQEVAETSLKDWILELEATINKGKKVAGEIEEEEIEVVMDTGDEGESKEIELQGALFSMDVSTGEVLAIVGGRDFSESEFNRAIQSKRQPGSAFKPIIYAAAIDSGYTPADIIGDNPVEYVKNEKENWKPTNYDGKFLGDITLREAFAKSRNLATVRLLEKVGIQKAIMMARNLGIESSIPSDLSIALGSVSLSLIELCEAYASIGNLGKRPTPIFIREVRDINGEVLETNKPATERVTSPETAYIMTYMLQSVIRDGTGRKARFLGSNLSGKTGTTNDYIDAWFIGFSPRVLAGVWVGFDKPIPMGKGKTGAVAALPIWMRYMQRAINKYPSTQFDLAPGIVFAKVDPISGLRVGRDEKGIMVPFKLGTTPPWLQPAVKRREEKKKIMEDIL
jgi:penicillin-binding protein 1A